MVAFLMLGIIPGTNVQIDFTAWLIAMTLLCAMLFARDMRRRQLLPLLLLQLAVRHAKFVPTLPYHQA